MRRRPISTKYSRTRFLDNYRVGAVSPEVAARIWPQIEGYIAKALNRGQLRKAYLPTDILAHVLRNPEWQLWIAATNERIDAAIVTRIHQYDRCRTCNVFIVGGRNMKDWLPLALKETEDYAKRMGCIAMEGGMRKGWARVAGYQVTSCALLKEF